MEYVIDYNIDCCVRNTATLPSKHREWIRVRDCKGARIVFLERPDSAVFSSDFSSDPLSQQSVSSESEKTGESEPRKGRQQHDQISRHQQDQI